MLVRGHQVDALRLLAMHDRTGNEESAPATAQTLERIYRQHVGYVYRVVQRFGMQSTEAEDATQEVFMVVHRRLADFDFQHGAMRSWLFAIARGVAANRRRSNKRRLTVVPPTSTAAQGPSPEQHTGHREVLRHVGTFLAKLPPKQREVFELIDIEGLRGPEVSELLQTKINTVYTRLRLARTAFKDYAQSLVQELGTNR